MRVFIHQEWTNIIQEELELIISGKNFFSEPASTPLLLIMIDCKHCPCMHTVSNVTLQLLLLRGRLISLSFESGLDL
jgi:hypothetical protein